MKLGNQVARIVIGRDDFITVDRHPLALEASQRVGQPLRFEPFAHPARLPHAAVGQLCPAVNA
jgi:hypothetical protein